MGVRFRFRAADGCEVEAASVEELVPRIAAGEIREDTVLYDAENGGWAPARMQGVFLSLARPVSGTTGQSSGAGASIPPASPVSSPGAVSKGRPGDLSSARSGNGARPDSGVDVDLPDLSFALAAVPEPPPADEVVAGLLRERDEEHSRRSPARTEGALALDLGHDRARPSEGARTGARALVAKEAPERPRPIRPHEIAPRDGERERRPLGVDADAGEREWSGNARWPNRLLFAAGAAMAVVATILLLAVMAGDATPVVATQGPLSSSAPAASSSPPAAEELSSSSVPRTAEGDALQDVLLEVEGLLAVHGVERVPPAWLEGAYLADATAFPDVRAYWTRFPTYVEEVRAAEGRIFREALAQRLEEHGLAGPVARVRLFRALEAFESDRPRRDAVYASMLELADAAVQLHDFLALHEAEISFEPASTGVSRDPVLEAVPSSPELKQEMDLHLDGVLDPIERTLGDRVVAREELPQALRRVLASGPLAARKRTP